MRTRPGALTVAFGLAVVVAACGPSTSASPVASAAASASPTASATAAAIAPPTAAPTATAQPPSQAPTPAATASGAACLVGPQTGILPSDRLTGMQVVGASGSDVIRFELGEASLEPVGGAAVTISPAQPPFSQASSGQPIDLAGEHALRIVFKHMSIQNDAGEPTYTGDRELKVTDPSRSIRDVVLFDELEGQVGWYVGYDGQACVSVGMSGDVLELAVAFGP